MPSLLQILFLSLIPFSFEQHNGSLIPWSAEKKLSWEDFRARPDRDSQNAAMTGTNIKFDFIYNSKDGFHFHIQCFFDKNSSWGRIKNDYILSHEQGHFDIAEIHARKLYKALKEYQPDIAKANEQLNRIYNKVMQELNATQSKYDEETNFSLNKEEQKRWLSKIEEELNSLQSYAGYH